MLKDMITTSVIEQAIFAVPFEGTVKGASVAISASNSTTDWTLELWKNGAPSGLSITVPALGALGVYNDDTEVAVEPGDALVWYCGAASGGNKVFGGVPITVIELT
jgi:hypothetical protein